jgi:hypothetical protein
MLNYFDFAFRLIVLKDFLDSASYFSMSFIVVLTKPKMYRIQQLCLRVFIRVQDLLHFTLLDQALQLGLERGHCRVAGQLLLLNVL